MDDNSTAEPTGSVSRDVIGVTRLPLSVRKGLRASQREAVGSSVMTGICDNYLGAFAVFLQASAQQVGWITAFSQLFGAFAQLFSVWQSRRGLRRASLIVFGAASQSVSIAVFVALCTANIPYAVAVLVVVATLFQAGSHFVQPQWRAIMARIVPVKRRGRFFARRSSITAYSSFFALTGGGLLLYWSQKLEMPAAGFALLFSIALVARIYSVRLLSGLREFDTEAELPASSSLRATVVEFRRTLTNLDFRRFTLFVALMQGSVAIAGPYFSVHMLRNLNFNYAEFMALLAASLFMQVLTLNSWGYIADYLGNRIVLITTAFIVPLLPLLWIFSNDYWYLLLVQGLAGIAWGGFTLSSSNYLYDLRPAGSELAMFSAVQGVMLGGLLAVKMPLVIDLGNVSFTFANSLYGVFALSFLLRFGVALWFTPRVAEIRLSPGATVNQVIYRLARFNPVTGMVMDFVGVVRKRRS